MMLVPGAPMYARSNVCGIAGTSIVLILVCSQCAGKRAAQEANNHRLNTYTFCQVRRHNRREDCWLVAHRRVYNATGFIAFHPAGPRPILSRAGKDCTVDYDFHSSVSQRDCTSFSAHSAVHV